MKKTLLPLLLLGAFTSIAQTQHFNPFKRETAHSKHRQFVNNLLVPQTQNNGTAQKPTGTQQRVIAQSSLMVEDGFYDTVSYSYTGTKGSKYNYNIVDEPSYNWDFSSDFLTGPYFEMGPKSMELLADTITYYQDGIKSGFSKAFYRTDNKLDSFFNYDNDGANIMIEKVKHQFNSNGYMTQLVDLSNYMNFPNFDTNQLRKFWYNTAGTQLLTDTIYQQETNGLEPYYATRYHYNTQNNLDSIFSYENNGGAAYDLSAKTSIQYDANNRVLKVINTSSSGGQGDYESVDSFGYTGTANFFTFYETKAAYFGQSFSSRIVKTLGSNNLPDSVKVYFEESGDPLQLAGTIKYHYNSYNNPDSLTAIGPDGSYMGRYYFYYETYSDGVSGTKDIQNNKDLNIYPNPFDNKINIEWKGQAGKTAKISLINIVGQLVYTHKMNLVSGANSIDLPNIKTGQYILLIQDEHGTTWSQKMIKK